MATRKKALTVPAAVVDDGKTTIDGAKEAVEWLRGRLSKSVPRHQHKGPFSKLARAYVPCPICTRMAVSADKKYVGTVGTTKQHQKRHLKDHRLGLIKTPVFA